ncbi:shufflon system plasmid conjugative transfer pilus tip adhesin PilV [Ralstonia pickettii]|uniref:shufflon system plasmid conjugative transfer pilus tip adhesin PilV n=1 Tax=Ralstonia pickettii TaxID=329 RepID=UPI0027154FB5|nr:shufflon system plasmid conjugative transfer pilus tip adhesin PilV [Ralstonia pickettii]WKZ86355.1 shufflon system plasmid conjugative transfer pilus tip adhesin PilV [Ralstonia pickettii]
MTQKYLDIPDSHTLQQSLPEILDNDKTALSCSAGESFPITNLLVGMLCYRSDQGMLYQLQDLSPNWVLIADLNRVPVWKDNPLLAGVLSLTNNRATLKNVADSLLMESLQFGIMGGRGGVFLAYNVSWDGTNWNRVDSTKGGALLQLASTSGPALFACGAGANPISAWNISNGAALWHAGNFDPASKLNKGGDTMTGPLTLAGDGTSALHAVTKQQLDTVASNTANQKVAKTGDTMTGNLSVPAVLSSTTYANNWFRSQGTTGWYSESFGGGIYMEDTTWVRVYNGKAFLVNNVIRSNGWAGGQTNFQTGDGVDLSQIFARLGHTHGVGIQNVGDGSWGDKGPKPGALYNAWWSGNDIWFQRDTNCNCNCQCSCG